MLPSDTILHPLTPGTSTNFHKQSWAFLTESRSSLEKTKAASNNTEFRFLFLTILRSLTFRHNGPISAPLSLTIKQTRVTDLDSCNVLYVRGKI